MNWMVVALLVAGVAALLAGVAAILFGIPVKEFSFGNTLVVVGAVGICTGLILLGLFAVVRELKLIALRLGAGASAEVQGRPPFRDSALAPGGATTTAGAFLNREQPGPPTGGDGGEGDAAAPAQLPRPRFADAAARERAPPPAQVGTEPAGGQTPQPRRSVMFSSNLRRERERAARAAEQAPPDDRFAPAPSSPSGASESAEPRPVSFETVWTQPERTRPGEGAPRRFGRPSYATGEPSMPAPEQPSEPPPTEEQPAVTVLKSGVVDGMAYSLYSDGSIEAQLPEGMMRFASIDELRAHLEQRP
jgi:hypothetical protein